MSNVEVNHTAVVLAALISMPVGAIWYHPKVFGSHWIKLAGLKQKELDKLGVWPMIITVLVALLTSYILAHVSVLSNEYFKNSFLVDSLQTAFFMWLGFTAARMITHDAFEGRRKKLTLLTVSHELLTFIVMALVIGLFGR